MFSVYVKPCEYCCCSVACLFSISIYSMRKVTGEHTVSHQIASDRLQSLHIFHFQRKKKRWAIKKPNKMFLVEREKRNSHWNSLHSIVRFGLVIICRCCYCHFCCCYSIFRCQFGCRFQSIRFSTIHCKRSIAYFSLSCCPLLYSHFDSITFIHGFWLSQIPPPISPTLFFCWIFDWIRGKIQWKFDCKWFEQLWSLATITLYTPLLTFCFDASKRNILWIWDRQQNNSLTKYQNIEVWVSAWCVNTFTFVQK